MNKKITSFFLLIFISFFIFAPSTRAQDPEYFDAPIIAEGAAPKCAFPLYVCIPELLVAKGDVESFLKKCSDAGAWGVRFFAIYSWSTQRLEPFKQWTSDGKLVVFRQPDTGKNFPVYDLNQPNQAYWQKLDRLLVLLKKYNLKPIISLTDYCSYKGDKYTKFFYPFLMAKQAMSPTDDRPYVTPKEAQKEIRYTPGGPYAENRIAPHANFFRLMIRHLSVYAFRVEICNEFGALRYVLEGDSETPKIFYKKLTDWVVKLGVPRNQILHSGWPDAARANGGTYCLHNIAKPETIPDKVFYMLSNDGAFNGRSATDIDIMGRRGPSLADAIKIAQIIKKRKMNGYEYMPRSPWKDDDCLVNLDYFNPAVVKAMTTASRN